MNAGIVMQGPETKVRIGCLSSILVFTDARQRCAWTASPGILIPRRTRYNDLGEQRSWYLAVPSYKHKDRHGL